MEGQLSHSEAQSLFGALVDDALAAREADRLRSHLSECESCKAGWTRYERSVMRVRNVPRERAPMALASSILRRERRRSYQRRMGVRPADHRVPVEIILPVVLLAACVVVLMLLWAR